MHPQLIRAILRAYDSSAHTAVIEPEAGPAASIAGMAVLSSCRPEELLPGRQVTVLAWPDGGGVVLGPSALPRASRLLIDSGFVQPSADVTLSDSYQDVITLSLSSVPSGARLAISAVLDIECTAWSANQYAWARLMVDGAEKSLMVERVTAAWLLIHLPYSWMGALASGSRSAKLQVRKEGAQNTVLAKTRSCLAWQLYA
ncbi:MAG: hypothetical protein LLG44_03480 [Chloroflexi bacterium]|nr:hypothetical protein [Chloroflexota bacterium]